MHKRAVGLRVRRAIRARVVDNVMHVPAEQVIGRRVSEHLQRGAIYECAMSLGVNAVNALAQSIRKVPLCPAAGRLGGRFRRRVALGCGFGLGAARYHRRPSMSLTVIMSLSSCDLAWSPDADRRPKNTKGTVFSYEAVLDWEAKLTPALADSGRRGR